MANTRLFRKGMEEAGFRIVPGVHPIVPVCLGHMPDDAKLSQDFANALLDEGIYVIGFYYPVVPEGQVPHPGPDQRRPHKRADRVRPGEIRQGRESPGGHLTRFPAVPVVLFCILRSLVLIKVQEA